MARILVIDDESNVRQMIRLALEYAGHKVDTAVDGSEGVYKYADGSAWDIVLLDHRMPGMSGVDTLRQVRRIDPDAKVIVITAFGTIDLAIEAQAAGASDFLRKPFTADTLRQAVHAVLERKAQPSRSGPLPYSLSTINGFHFETASESPTKSPEGIECLFTIRGPNLETTSCRTVIDRVIVEQIQAQSTELPGGDRFWQGLAGEALANYLWQNAEAPIDGLLKIEELTTGLQRWIDSTLA